jgi:hypothetical protein
MALMGEGRVERLGRGEGRGVRRHSRLPLVGGSDQGRPSRVWTAVRAARQRLEGASFLARRHLI